MTGQEEDSQPYWNPELWRKPFELRDIALNEPPQTDLLGPLRTGQVGWIAAPPGVGKSMLALSIALAIGEGHSLGLWQGSGERCPVKLLDAELTNRDLSERLVSLGGMEERTPLNINTWGIRDQLGIDSFSLGDTEHQLWLMQTVAGAEAIIIDNVTFTLDPAPGGNMYSPETINQLKPLLAWTRNTGRLLIFIDHTNAQGELAGSMQKARMADWVMILEKDVLVGDLKLAFTLTWKKYRNNNGPQIGDQEAWGLKPDGTWDVRKVHSIGEQIKELVIAGATVKDISQELDVSPRTVRRFMR